MKGLTAEGQPCSLCSWKFLFSSSVASFPWSVFHLFFHRGSPLNPTAWLDCGHFAWIEGAGVGE